MSAAIELLTGTLADVQLPCGGGAEALYDVEFTYSEREGDCADAGEQYEAELVDVTTVLCHGAFEYYPIDFDEMSEAQQRGIQRAIVAALNRQLVNG
jgi:hypothetical protein